MYTIELKALKPGSGKTTVLVKLFHEDTYDISYKRILTPTNKAAQVCIKKLITEHHWIPKVAEKHVYTLKKFKKNYNKAISMDEEGNFIEQYITTESMDRYSKKPYHIYIDEASMISKKEMDDLITHTRISLLVLDGDSLQFDPIGSESGVYDNNNIVVETKQGNILETKDDGTPWSLPIDTQVLLTKQMRSYDISLQKAIDCIKNGQLVDGLRILDTREEDECYKLPTDMHIAYTKGKCNKLNSLYSKPSRYIIKNNDNVMEVYKGQIYLEADIEAMKDRYIRHVTTKLPEDTTEETFTQKWLLWKEKYSKPAMAVNCHKLQGETLYNKSIFIHIDDILIGLQGTTLSVQEKALLFQKFLYVAISRAVRSDQVHIFGLGMHLNSIFHKHIHGENEHCTDVVRRLYEYQSLVGPMIDTTIRKNPCKYEADDPELIDFLLDLIINNPEEDIALKNRIYKKKNEKVSEKKRIYTDEMLKNMSWNEVKNKGYNIKNRWRKMHI